MADRSGVTPEMATKLAAAFGTTAAYWLKLAAVHGLSQVRTKPVDVERRAKIYSLAPIRELQKRGWVRGTQDLSELEDELKRFFDVPSLDEIPIFPVATKRSVATIETFNPASLTPAQRAWCFRARALARGLAVVPYGPTPESHLALTDELRELAAYPKESRHVPAVLSKYGIRFVVVEPLPGAKIDGAAFWLSETSPVIAVSIRYDRIDNFWFTIMHELSHVRHGDALSVDIDIERDEVNPDERLPINLMEQRANVEAAAYLIPRSELDSFVGRVSPLYSRDRIIQFAHSIKIHPGIIIGQLQHRGELHSSANRDLLARIRDAVVETALTDGWGRSVGRSAAID